MARFYRGKARKQLHKKAQQFQATRKIPRNPKMTVGCAVCGKPLRLSPQFIRIQTKDNIPIVCSNKCAMLKRSEKYKRSSTTDETTKPIK